MFDPTREQVRAFFREALERRRRGGVLEPAQALASDWIERHPEYHDLLAPLAPGETERFEGRDGEANPFLHLSMHLSIEEQVSVDQPRGIRAAIERLAVRTGSLHDAHHEAMECLGEMLWRAQREGAAPDGDAYVRCVEQRAGAR